MTKGQNPVLKGRTQEGKALKETDTACVPSRFSHDRLFVTPWTIAHQVPLSWHSPGKSTGVGCHALLQGIFLSQ